jgi:hypothetical protein
VKSGFIPSHTSNSCLINGIPTECPEGQVLDEGARSVCARVTTS